MNVACMALNTNSSVYMLKEYTRSGIKTIQLRSFNESQYYEKLAAVLDETPGLTVDKLASKMRINVLIMKEQILQAEEKGFICVDESHEGNRYHPNNLKTLVF